MCPELKKPSKSTNQPTNQKNSHSTWVHFYVFYSQKYAEWLILQEIESCLSVGALSSWLKADINDDKNFNLEESWMEETSFSSMPEDLM